MQRATLHLKLTTPAFLGGADQKAPAEWRAASVRGQLRWWFRAIAGAVHGGDLRAVRRLETAAFGATSRRSPLQVEADGKPSPHLDYQSKPWNNRCFAERLAELWGESPPSDDTVARLKIENDHGGEVPSDPIDYLAYGPIDRGKRTRAFLEPGTGARLRLLWRPGRGSEVEQVEPLLRLALWAWLHLGGIGGRSRKGFGSLSCEEIQGSLPFVDGSLLLGDAAFADGLAEIRSEVPKTASTSLPEWSYFSPLAKVYVAAESHASWTDALLHGGAWLMAFRRRYGYPGDGRVHKGVPLRGRDYAWVSQPGGTHHPGATPDRAGFGLPLPFFLRSRGGAKPTVSAGSASAGRRASPLLLHIRKLESGRFSLVLTHLPAALAAPGEEIHLHTRDTHNRPWSCSAPPTPRQLGIVSHFLQDLESKALIREVQP